MNTTPSGDDRPIGSAYPAGFTFDPADRVANWRPLVHWLLAIPHLAILYALQTLTEVLSIVSWFSIVFTGKVPAASSTSNRWRCATHCAHGATCCSSARSTRRSTSSPRPPTPVRTHACGSTSTAVGGPQPADRGVPADPRDPARDRVGRARHRRVLVSVVGFFAVLFTGRWPAGARQFVLGVARWWLRVQSYLVLLHDEYPPFSLS